MGEAIGNIAQRVSQGRKNTSIESKGNLRKVSEVGVKERFSPDWAASAPVSDPSGESEGSPLFAP